MRLADAKGDPRESAVVRLVETPSISVTRLNGIPRAAEGRHKRLVAYTAATVSTPELIRLLRDAAERLARTLPKVGE